MVHVKSRFNDHQLRSFLFREKNRKQTRNFKEHLTFAKISLTFEKKRKTFANNHVIII